MYDVTAVSDCSLSTVGIDVNTSNFTAQSKPPAAGTSLGDSIIYQFTADARLGA
jgi:hypothetical protein